VVGLATTSLSRPSTNSPVGSDGRESQLQAVHSPHTMFPSRSAEPEAAGRGRFATTQWSLVLAAAKRDSAEAEQALARLCALYWYPVFAFVRRQAHSTEEAEDLTQGFFARLIEKGDIGDADRSRGRFRTFLLTACQHYLLNERDRMLAVKRGGGHAALSIDVIAAESRYQRALAHSETPERLYDRQWCLTLLASVLDDLSAEYLSAGNEAQFARLRAFLTMPDDAGTHADAARELGMTASAVKAAVHRLRRRYRDALRRRVADTVESPQDIDDEMHFLLETLRNH
jgi:RNA polymerase sigma factor (sigma-70 family)